MYQVLEQFSDHLIIGNVFYTRGEFNPHYEMAIKEFEKTNYYILYYIVEIETLPTIDKLEWLYGQITFSLENELSKRLITDELREELGLVGVDLEEPGNGELDFEEDNFIDIDLFIDQLFKLKKLLFLDYYYKVCLEKLGLRYNLNLSIGPEIVIYKLTKINFYLLLSIIVAVFLLVTNKKKLFGKESFWSQGEKSFVKFIYNLIKEQTGIEGIVHLPLIATIFLFILLNNLIGLLPFGYTLTSHIMVTFFLGFSSFLGITILIMVKKEEKMINLFLPKGVPTALVPFLFVIEIISYIFRTVSLSVRLFANMMAGHALLHILSNFGVVIISLKTPSRFFFVFPLIIVFAITFLELGIAILQAYVFAVLLTIYLNDVYAKESH